MEETKVVRLTTYDRGEITVLGDRATVPAHSKKNSEILCTTSDEQTILIIDDNAIIDICRSSGLGDACGYENTRNLTYCFRTLLSKCDLPISYILSGEIIIRECNGAEHKSAVDITITEAINILGDVINEAAPDIAGSDIQECRECLYLCEKAWNKKKPRKKQ